MTLPQLPHDKSTHVIYGAAIFAAAHIVTTLTGNGAVALYVGAGITVAFGVGKEIMDWLENNRSIIKTRGVEIEDALATIAGGALVALPLVVR